MGMINDLVPLNLVAEREKFLRQRETYQPQFAYRRAFSAAELAAYGPVQAAQLAKARAYLQHANFPPSPSRPPFLTFEQLETRLYELCETLGVPPIPLVKCTNQGSRFMFATSGQLRVRWPVKIDAAHYEMVLNHEIQTHFLRQFNDKKQPWAAEKRNDVGWRRTEEGLAMYNSKDKKNPDLRAAAFLYLLVDTAQQASFQDVYHQALERDPTHELKAWRLALRVKRGVTDTQQPGGYTKDLVYWEGYQQVAAWLAEPGHDWHDLYWGRVSLEDLEVLRPRAQTAGLVYPHFAADE